MGIKALSIVSVLSECYASRSQGSVWAKPFNLDGDCEFPQTGGPVGQRHSMYISIYKVF